MKNFDKDAWMKTIIDRLKYLKMLKAIVKSIDDVLIENGYWYKPELLDWANRTFHINFPDSDWFWEEYSSDDWRIDTSTWDITEETVCFEEPEVGRVEFPLSINLQSFVSSLNAYMSHIKHGEEANKGVE